MKTSRFAWVLLAAGLGIFLTFTPARALDQGQVPAIYKNIFVQNGIPLVKKGEKILHPLPSSLRPKYTITMLQGSPKGTAKGFDFLFADREFGLNLNQGTLFYSLWQPAEGRFPLPKYRFDTPIKNGFARLDMDDLKGKFDFIGWEKQKKGMIYYRVADGRGRILYEGRFAFSGNGPFKVDVSVAEGPFVVKVTDSSAVIALKLNRKAPVKIILDKRVFDSPNPAFAHKIPIDMLEPGRSYTYTVAAGGHIETYSLATAPAQGSQKPFTFCFGSDSRNSINSGERNMNGVNAYVLRRAMVLASFKNTAFLQFTGDTMTGYKANIHDQKVQMTAFKRAILPWASRMPVFVGMGNHESLVWVWDDGSEYGLSCDRFPFADQSAEAIFASEFVMPENGPISEDGAWYDPNPHTDGDFPTYKGNVFYYIWGNTAMVVLNTHYLMGPSLPKDKTVGGNLWGYLLDNQIAWLAKTLADLEKNPKIDHIFITQHTPVFPNGGHGRGARSMWFGGSNKFKPVFNSVQPDAKQKIPGCLERRDQYLKILMSAQKLRGVLCGDEHNYSRLLVKEGIPLYDPAKYQPKDPLKITKSFWHITIGTVGAPYYAKVDAPWNLDYPANTDYLKAFSPRKALAFFHVNGKNINLEVVDSLTLELIDQVEFTPVGQ